MENTKKYEFTEEYYTESDESILHRIRSLRDFGDVHKGDLGGFIEKERNLSQEGDAWVYRNACAFNDARVSGNAQVFGHSCVRGNAEVFGNANVADALVCENSRISGNVRVFGNVTLFDNAQILGSIFIKAEAARFGKYALINNTSDFYTVGNLGKSEETATFYRTESSIYVTCGSITSPTQFNDSIESFEQMVKETFHDTEYEKQYLAAITFAKTVLE